MKDNILIKIDNISCIRNNNIIFSNLSFEIKKNVTTLITGSNGAGKTTLLKILFGLQKPSEGKILYNYESDMRKCFIFQTPVFLDRSVCDNLENTLYCANISKKRWKYIINEKLEEFNLLSLKNKKTKSISGGELQMISFIRALIMNPDIIFYDEPFNNLDNNFHHIVVSSLRSLAEKGKQLILVSHDDILMDSLECNIISLNRKL